MSLEDRNSIDWLGIEKGSGRLLLTIIDDLDWSNEILHLQMLQEKLTAYFAAIETGEAFEQFGRTTKVHAIPAKGASVLVLAKHAPSATARAFLEHVGHVAREVGVDFTYKILGVNEL